VGRGKGGGALPRNGINKCNTFCYRGTWWSQPEAGKKGALNRDRNLSGTIGRTRAKPSHPEKGISFLSEKRSRQRPEYLTPKEDP
jgi:hypothetical protein